MLGFAMFWWLCHPACGLRTDVTLPFEIPFSRDGEFVIGTESSAREFFPQKDIFISVFEFKGVSLPDGTPVVFHHHLNKSAEHRSHDDWWSPDKTMRDPPGTFEDDFVYHHTILHQGTRSAPFVHSSQTPLVYGTTAKRTSFAPYGIRLRPDSPIFSCMHGLNIATKSTTYQAHWRIEYRVLDSSKSSPRSIIAGWLHCCGPLAQKTSGEELNLPLQITFSKNVTLLAFVVHNHAWLQGLKIESRGEKLLTMKGAEAKSMDDAHLKWLKDGPRRMPKGSSLTAHVAAFFESPHDASLPMGITFYVLADDRTDSLNLNSDLFFKEYDIKTFLHPKR